MFRRAWWVVALGLIVPGPLARADETFGKSLDDLRKAEQARGVEQLTLVITQRQAAAQPGETIEAARARVAAMSGGSTAEATLLRGPAGWREEWSSIGATSGRTVIVATGDRIRTLIETTGGGATERQGIVADTRGATPADALLAGHLADYLAGFRPDEPAAGVSDCHLSRGAQKLSIRSVNSVGSLRWIDEIAMERPLPQPGAGDPQLYRATIGWPPPFGGAPTRIAGLVEVIQTPAPFSTVAYREIRVLSDEPATSEDAISTFRFPAGTAVRDQRFGVPVEYEQGAADMPDDRVRELADQEAVRSRIVIGQPAPELALDSEHGEPFRLSEQKGKVVLLYWYAPWSEQAAKHTAELERDVAAKYRKRGVEVVGIQVIAEGDARAEAQAFRTRQGLSFPLLIDPDAATLRRFGPGLGVPQVVVVDRSGAIRYAETGWNAGAVTAAVQAAMAGGKGARAAGLRHRHRHRHE